MGSSPRGEPRHRPRYDEAAGLITCARDFDPSLVFAIEAQALLAHRRKDCPEATRLIGEAAARMPSDANVHYSAGVIHFKCGDRPGAAAELRTGIKGSVGVTTWIEQNTSGKTDAYVEVKGTLGAGVDVDGVATVGCDFFNASAKFNLRAFAETLTH